MIAVPREDGGVAVHGSLQCPYYIHKAMKRALRLNDAQAQVVQAETGGGFGGKEEYPSIIALHAALLARKSGKPVRMIYDRHEDLSATTKRHPAIVTHRTGVKADGTIVAQEIEVVMDGGAYCTLTPVVLSPRRDPRRRAVPLPERPDPGPGDADEHPAERRVPRLRRAAGRVRRRDPGRPPRRGAGHEPDRDPPPEPLPRGRHDADRPGPPRERRRVGGARASRRGGRVRGRPGADGARPRPAGPAPGRVPAAPLRTGRDRVASGIGDRARLARRRVHRLGRGQARVASRRSSWAATASSGSSPARPRWARGRRRSSPSSSPPSWASPYEDVEIAPQDTAIVPDSGPTVASRTAMVVGGLLIQAARRLRAEVEERNGGRPFAEVYRSDSVLHGHTRVDQQFEPYPGVDFDDETYRGDAYPAFGWAACVAIGRRRPRQRRGHGPRRRRRRRRRPGDPPGPRRGPGRGRHAPGDRLRDDRGDQAARRPLPERPARDVHHPDRARRAADHVDPRRGAVQRRAARREGRSASCRWTSARRRSSPRSTTRPASGSTTCRRRRSGSSRRWARPATWPGRPGSAAAAAVLASRRRSTRRSAPEPTPRPTCPTDPQPLRGPGPDDRRVDDGWHDA